MRSPLDTIPLTEAQEGLWYAQRLDPRNPIFNAGHCTEIRNLPDVALFVRAVNQTLEEADALTLAFIDDDAGPRQYLAAERRPVLEHVRLDDSPESLAQARRAMLDDLNTAVDPVASPLARHLLFSIGNRAHLWYQRAHHLAADGYAMALIENRAFQIYRALLDDKTTGTPLTPFGKIAEDDAAYRQGERRGKDALFWKEQLQGLADIGSLAEGSALTADTALTARQAIAPETLALLKQRQDATQSGWPDIVTALVAAYVQRHTGQRRVVVGAPWMGRMGNASARGVATVMNVVPLVLEIAPDAPLDELIARCARQLAQTRRHGRYRGEQMRRDLGLPGGQGRIHGPLVNILPFDAVHHYAGFDARPEVLCAGPVEDFNFNFRAAPDGSGMRLELEANPRLYTLEQVQAHLARVIAFLHAALQADTLRPVQTLHADEFRHWVREVNQTAHPVPDTTLAALVAQTCARQPDDEALRMNGASLSFSAFDAQTTRAARALRRAGVGPRDIVAVALPRGAEMVMALHAIQRAGAAYLPLDIEQPRERIQRILAAARPAAVVGTPATFALLESGAAMLDAAALFDPASENDASPLPEAQPGDPAYVIYTSGSTGEPKGVVVSHRAIVNRLLWMKEHYGLSPVRRFLQKTPYTFDVSVWELFLPMLCGAPLVIAPPGLHRDPQALARLIRQEGIDVVHFVPSMLAAFLDEPDSAGLALAHVFCSGEALPARLRDRFHARMASALHNLYGPTEAAVDVSYWEAGANDRSDPVPIGFPVWNTRLYVLDDCQRPVPPGVTGTLYLAGRQLADGYLGRPDLTAERFVADPYAEEAGSRMYDTGDLARWREDGAVEYLGRTDDQIKLRGQRIELGEIETALGAHPMCRQLAVVARADAAGELRLVAYVVPREEAFLDGADVLLAYARDRLPPAMVPSAVVFLPALPVNANGKLDRQALPAPRFASRSARAAGTPSEERVALAFQAVLELAEAPGADDDFFTLGGHSLLAARLASMLREQTGMDLTLGAVFEHPSVARLGAWLDRLAHSAETRADAGFGPVFTLREGPPETPALFCIHPAGGLSWCYGPLARRLSGPRAVYGLQSPALDGPPAGIGTLRELAGRYADRIQSLQAAGPYHLLGWSVGGIIVQELACELRQRGAQVGVACLLDAYPSDAWRDRPPPEAKDAYRAILHIAGYDPDSLPGLRLDRASVIDFLRASGHALGALATPQLNGILDAVAFNNALVRRHGHRRYDGELLYVRAALDHQGENLHPAMWAPWTRAMAVHDVPALHAHLPGEPALGRWLPILETALRAQDAARATQETPCGR